MKKHPVISFHAFQPMHPLNALSRGLHDLLHPYEIGNKDEAGKREAVLRQKRRAQRLNVISKTLF